MTEEINEELSGLSIKIEKYEDSSMSNGENAFIIYLIVDNKISNRRKINLLKATYVTHKREQLEQDIWLTGYITGEDTLKPNSFKKAGLVFYKSKLKSISENDIIYITIELPQEGTELSISFKMSENKWQMTQVENTELEIKLRPKQLEKILLKKIERLEAFEGRLGVSIQNLSLKLEESYVWARLYCELHTINGTKLNESIYLECALYGNDGSILGKQSVFINEDDFFGFELVEIAFTGNIEIAGQVSKIRIYPKK
jgi:hypothetical protein